MKEKVGFNRMNLTSTIIHLSERCSLTNPDFFVGSFPTHGRVDVSPPTTGRIDLNLRHKSYSERKDTPALVVDLQKKLTKQMSDLESMKNASEAMEEKFNLLSTAIELQSTIEGGVGGIVSFVGTIFGIAMFAFILELKKKIKKLEKSIAEMK